MILGPTARPYITLGGEYALKVHRIGELVQSFQYVNTEPAMIIWSATRKAGAFAICLSAAHQYLEDEYLVFQAMSAAHHIGYSPKDRSVVGKIADLILAGLDELVRMPPEPAIAVKRREQTAEVLLRAGGPDGDIISHQEIMHDPLEQMQ
jgi:hypothetical protein